MFNSHNSSAAKMQLPAYLFVILRVYLGVILLITVYGKLFGKTPFSDEMLGFLGFVVKGHYPPAFYLSFLQSTVIPNAKLFSYLVMTGEVVAGLGLLTGTMTRLAALVALVLFINFMFAKGAWFWSPNSQDAAVFFIALVLMLGNAGRYWGIDVYLAKRWPNSILW